MRIILALAATALLGTSVGAADLGRTTRDSVSTTTTGAPGLVVSVDELYLRSGCPRNADCLPPRVLPGPTEPVRGLIPIVIPVDPRFVAR